MELVERLGGLGKVIVSPAELGALRTLTTIAKLHEINTPHLVRTGEVPEFMRAMETLFSHVLPNTEEEGPDLTKGYYCYQEIGGDSPAYKDVGIVKQVVIKVREDDKTTHERGYALKALVIMKPIGSERDNLFYMTAEPTRENPHVDDLVTMLGAGCDPCITGVREYKTTTGGTFQGIAEVPYLREVIRLYKRAREILENIPEELGVNRSDLERLRAEAYGNQNLAIRRSSLEMYHETLARILLAHQPE